MIGKETTFGTAVTPTVTLICSDAKFTPTNDFLERPGARQRIGRTRPSTGMYMVKGSFSHEADPDTLGALLKLLMGAETITSDPANPSALAVSTTLSAAVGIGFNAATPASMANIVVGQSLTVDTAGNAETVVVKAVTSTTFYAYFTKSHASAVAVANASVVSAYDHVFTLASPRASFTTQTNRITDAANWFGCKMSDMSFSINEKSILEAKCTVEAQADAYVGSPTTPAYSTLDPFIFETSGNYAKINGVNSDATVQSWSLAVSTGLIADFPNFGNGRLRAQMPETVTKVSGTMQLAFETVTMMQNFWGIPGATGPQNKVLPVGLDFKFVSSDYINTALPYSLEMLCATAMLQGEEVDMKPADYLKQVIKFECFESTNGAGDDIKITLVNAASGASI